MIRTFLMLFMLIIASGCASFADLEPFEYRLAANEAPLVPVRVHVNRRVPVPRFYVSRIDAVTAELKRSGVFFDAGSHVDSPFLLDIELHRTSDEDAGDIAGHLFSAATLFLVPTTAENRNELTVNVYFRGNRVKSYAYQDDYEETLSVYNYSETVENRGNEFVSIRNLVNRFINDLVRDGYIPRVDAADDVERSRRLDGI